MELSVTNGGTLGLANGRTAWVNFYVMSNELSTPKILHCPSDTSAITATNFSIGFGNRNISYFVNLDAYSQSTNALLSGDSNFEIDSISAKSELLILTTNSAIAWTDTRHKLCGNILLSDGSVQMVNNNGLKNLVLQTGIVTNRLAIP